MGGFTVTASSGNGSVPGIQLAVYQVTGGQLAATPNVVTAFNGGSQPTVNLTAQATGCRWISASILLAGGQQVASGSYAYGASHTLFVDGATTDSVIGWSANTSFDSSSAGSPIAASQVIAISGGNGGGTSGGVCAVEVDPSSGSTQPAVSNISGIVISTGNFSTSAVTTSVVAPPSGSLLFACVSAPPGALASSANGVSMIVSDSYGLTWTELGNAGIGAYGGIWYAVVPASPSLASGFPTGVVGAGYAVQPQAIEGQAPYSWGINSGSLPAGLTMDPTTGIISGVPTAAGTTSLTVGMTDAAGATPAIGAPIVVITDPGTAPRFGGTWHAYGGAYSYRTTTCPISPNAGEWLVVGVSWNTGQDAAMAYVTDDAHNVYRPIGIAASGSGGVACQLFAAPNIRATTSVYVSTTAYVRSLQVIVLSIRGMQAGYTILASDSSVGSASSGWTTPNSGSTPGGSLLIALGASQAGSLSLGSPWTRWGFQASGSPGSPYRHSSVLAHCLQPSTSTASAAFSMTGADGSRPFAGIIAAISPTAAPVISSSNPAWPSVNVSLGINFAPVGATAPIIWQSLESWRFLALQGQRGREFELDEIAAADLTLTLDNNDGHLTPSNTGSPLYPNVTLITPVQITADWQGQHYSIFTGVIASITESWEFERSVVKIDLTDDFSKLPQVLLSSAMTAEQLYDDPLHLWPLNDQQNAPFASNWSGRGLSTLVPVNSKWGAGSQNASSPPGTTGFGNTNGNGVWPSGLSGSTDTVWGNNSGIGTAEPFGTALVDRNDHTLPTHNTGGATYEVWAKVYNYTANLNQGAVIISLADVKGRHVSNYLKLVAVNYGTTSAPTTNFYVTHGNRTILSAHAYRYSPINTYDGKWHHYAITVQANRVVTLYVDGVFLGSHKAAMASAPPNRLQFGGDMTTNPSKIVGTIGKLVGVGKASPDVLQGTFSGFLSQAAVYDRVLDQERLAAHVASGQTGFANEVSGRRISHVLAWAKWSGPQAIESGRIPQQPINYLGQGYASSGLSGSIGAYNTAGGAPGVDDGAQADMTIQDIANTECGFLFVGADGVLVFKQRDSVFNHSAKWTFSDGDNALNQTTSFANGLGAWSPTSPCTLVKSTAWSYDGGASALLTVVGSHSAVLARAEMVPVTPGMSLGASVWCMAPQDQTGHMAIDWYNASGYMSTAAAPNTYIAPNTPTLLSLSPVQPPAGATYCLFGPTIISPVIGSQFAMDRPRISRSGYAAAYQESPNWVTDIQYLFNDIMVTRNIDQASYRARSTASRAQYYPRVLTRTIYTSQTDPSGVVDVANWLLSGYESPHERVNGLIVDAAAEPDYWPVVLCADIGDFATFSRTPVQGARVFSNNVIIGLEIDISPDKAQWTYTLAPYASLASTGTLAVLTLGDPTYGPITVTPLGM